MAVNWISVGSLYPTVQFIIYGSYYALISVLFLIRGTYTACASQRSPEHTGPTKQQDLSGEVISAERFWPRSTNCCCLDLLHLFMRNKTIMHQITALLFSVQCKTENLIASKIEPTDTAMTFRHWLTPQIFSILSLQLIFTTVYCGRQATTQKICSYYW